MRRDLWKRFWQRCQHLSGSRDVDRDLEILDLALFQGWTSREIAVAKGKRSFDKREASRTRDVEREMQRARSVDRH